MKQFLLKKISWLVLNWKIIITSLVIICISVISLGLQPDVLKDSYNKFEYIYINDVKELSIPAGRIVNAPHSIPSSLIGSAIDDYLLAGRIVTFIYSLLATLTLLYVIKKWYTLQIAVVGALLFTTSSWVLVVSHQALPIILMVFTPLLLLAVFSNYVAKRRTSYLSFLALAISLAFAAYVPYMFWMIISIIGVVVFVYHRYIFTYKSWQLAIASITYLILLLPLAISLSQYPGQLRDLLGIPQQLPSFPQYISNFLEQIYSIFIYTQPFDAFHIKGLPMLDIFSAIMLLLGLYHFKKFMPKKRVKTVFIILTIFILLIPLSPLLKISLTVLIPFIYIFIPSGVNEILRQWFEYFPRNPIARNGAVVLLVVAIGLATFYNLQRYYIAWPDIKETKSSYMLQSNNKE